VTESTGDDAVLVNETRTVAAVVESDFAVVAVPSTADEVRLITVACDGATERTPRPKAATATCATRLNVVFVDICFLSIVDPREIRRSAWNQFPDSARFIARADESNSPPCIRTR